VTHGEHLHTCLRCGLLISSVTSAYGPPHRCRTVPVFLERAPAVVLTPTARCLTCPRTVEDSRRSGQWEQCSCGASYRAPRKSAATEFENLARHLPSIEGRAVATGLDGVAPVVGDGNSGGGTRINGRPDHVDSTNPDLARAYTTLDRLDTIAQHAGGIVLDALVYRYLLCGPEERRDADRFDERMGRVFANREQRIAWLLNPAKSVGENASRRSGKGLRERAVDAFEVLEWATVIPRVGSWLADARDRVSRRMREEHADTHTLRKTLAENRETTTREARRAGVRLTITGNTGNTGS
jgi:hypothetical protein